MKKGLGGKERKKKEKKKEVLHPGEEFQRCAPTSIFCRDHVDPGLERSPKKCWGERERKEKGEALPP